GDDHEGQNIFHLASSLRQNSTDVRDRFRRTCADRIYIGNVGPCFAGCPIFVPRSGRCITRSGHEPVGDERVTVGRVALRATKSAIGRLSGWLQEHYPGAAEQAFQRATIVSRYDGERSTGWPCAWSHAANAGRFLLGTLG